MNKNMYLTTGNMLKLIFPNIKMVTYIPPMFKLITRLLKHNGTLFTVKYLKQVRLHVTRYLAGKPLLTNNVFVSLDGTGGPTVIDFLKPLVQGSIVEKKLLLTLLGLSRNLRPKKKEVIPIDTSSITSPYKGTGYIIPNSFIKLGVDRGSARKIIEPFSLKSIFFSMKSGPNGPATLTIPMTILSMGYDMFHSLSVLLNLEGFNGVCRLYKLCWELDLQNMKVSTEPDSPRNWRTSRRLSVVKDPECKMRIIAIFDYISQLVLTPISDKLFEILKSLPTDRTFTQSPFHTGEVNNEHFGSIDLSSATDRFPLEFQKRVLGYIFSDIRLASSGAHLLVGPTILDLDGNPIQYSVGQPMGAKSSGPAFSISHHILVNFCASLEGYTDFDQYILLGDDIVIKNDKVAKRYIDTLAKIGVDTSEAKTHVSINTYEFAKRWIQDGQEISGLPMNGILDNIQNPFIIGYILFDHFVIKSNTYVAYLGLDKLVASFYSKTALYSKKNKKGVKGKPLSFRGVLSQISNFSFVMRILFNLSSYDEKRKFFAKHLKEEIYMLPTPNAIQSELDRVFGDGMNGMVFKAVKKIDSVFNSLGKISETMGIERALLPHFPIWDALRNRVEGLTKLQNKILKGATLKDMVETLLLVDIDSVSQLERNSFDIVVKTGQLTTIVAKHLAFDPEYTVPKARSHQIVKSTRELLHKFKQESKTLDNICVKDSS